MHSLDTVLAALHECQITPVEMITTLLTSRQYKDHPFASQLVDQSPEIFRTFLGNPATREKVVDFCLNTAGRTCLQEIHSLAAEESGWHFGACSASTKQMEDFSLEEMAKQMEAYAPKWWAFIGMLFGEEGAQERAWGDAEMDVDEEMRVLGNSVLDTYWNEVDEVDLEGLINVLTGEGHSRLSPKEKRAKHCSAIRMMVGFILR